MTYPNFKYFTVLLKWQKQISEATFMHEKCPHFLEDFPLRLLVPFEEGHQQFLQPKLGF